MHALQHKLAACMHGCTAGGHTSQEIALSTLPGTSVEMLREELETSSTQGCSRASALQAEPQPVTNSLVVRCPASQAQMG